MLFTNSLSTLHTLKRKKITCVASVPVLGQRVLVFPIRDARKMGREQKGGRKGVGEGKERTFLLSSFLSPTPFLPPFCSRPIFRAARMTSLRAPNFVRFERERLLRRLRRKRLEAIYLSLRVSSIILKADCK